ncbi:hypothetical protein [Kibdelosporangium phytohabitans]|uniref:hypothetical protein n=1 Tax=Kibdelosporangium phytohabitans TaxID=860235 RepID=UPI0019DC164C|nr:hypothetical protein [Kibdelosporangium phytohabitans]MBE1471613.1 uncharacterized protein YbjT (DUF2867 family) [Kibdelosporangium phytohabitans]
MATGDGEEPFIDVRDIADVAVATLTEPGHAGKRYELSGPRLLSWAEAVEEVARATGRAITYTPITPERQRADFVARGFPPQAVDVFLALFEHIREHRAEWLSDGVQQVLGRAPRDFRDYAKSIR